MSCLAPYGISGEWHDIHEQIREHGVQSVPWLHVFAHNGHELGVQLLIDKGFDPRTRGFFQETVFELVAERGDFILMGILLDSVKDVDMDNILNTTAKMGHAALLQSLVERGANINLAGGQEPLLIVGTREGQVSIVRLLLEEGAETEARNKVGETALIVASKLGYTEIVELLVKSGAKLAAKNSAGETALRVAQLMKFDECIRVLKAKQQTGSSNCVTI